MFFFLILTLALALDGLSHGLLQALASSGSSGQLASVSHRELFFCNLWQFELSSCSSSLFRLVPGGRGRSQNIYPLPTQSLKMTSPPPPSPDPLAVSMGRGRFSQSLRRPLSRIILFFSFFLESALHYTLLQQHLSLTRKLSLSVPRAVT